MAKSDNFTDFLKDMADAIREVTGISGPINPQDFADIIRGLSSGSYGLEFPVYLHTSEVDSGFRRREADATSVSIVGWYDNNRVDDPSGGHYIPTETLAGKIFIDGVEVTSIFYNPSAATDVLFFGSAEDYGMTDVWKTIQYTAAPAIPKGTIDIMSNG